MDFGIDVNHGHVPVMRDRMGDLLRSAVEKFADDAVIVDGTLGAGGHTEYFLSEFPRVSVIGIDRDEAALEKATQRLAQFGGRFVPVRGRFDCLAEELQANAHPVFERVRETGLAGAFFDLGVSSMQLDQEERGFAYRVDAPLDMRMDPSSGMTAADVLNTYSHGDLARVLKTYGDERFAGKIASAVLAEREKEPFDRSGRLVDLLYKVIPAATRRTGGHPAKRTFQALRVEVNRELEALANVIPMVADALGPGGRAVFMSYQSHEDKIVKRAFADMTESKTPAGLPTELPGMEAKFRLVTHGAEQASDAEIELNRRAASVRVRAVEKLNNEPPGGAR
ncbi:16S rRNA (cytosine(1402)-N(4))-methyltransferase RsmH [Corynebacterium sp. p3-SID1145]|uniref:16S rRNA (cytosine(1402)-N(4))-methyltransferase RsmH n=1 Tax=unclassified Corynebacterium TaxID=2624378 RepID=UPI0021A9F314|nr:MULTISPECIES: 16S rRNA (cytosine(1402)-N(4))-methyltransferase RsmH [unclassified Corynebacterium]MCT1451505.1 16S rRNA (cytosine(1402)-N(4))-methyltransferase RsmH [Corynebacterium sp. p3-SID1145]MCT1460488.1 16S rRNA (cytosine(1402)-N(4))-methyltransferase RsmH [Corynebacterium sp. p3-SID1140]